MSVNKSLSRNGDLRQDLKPQLIDLYLKLKHHPEIAEDLKKIDEEK